jgi:magnesium transporter
MTMDAEMVLLAAFADRHPAGFARVLEQAGARDAAAVVAELGARRAAPVVAEMMPAPAARCVEALSPEAAAELVGALDVDAGAALLRRAGAGAREAVLAALPAAHKQALARLLLHEPGTAGAIMDPLVLAIPLELTCGQALERVRAEPHNAMYYVYVLGGRGELAGVVNQRELMIAAPDERVEPIMTANPLRILASAHAEAVADHPAWQIVHALPVVDRAGLFVGAIRYEIARRLERDLGRGRRAADRAVTAQALAELYGLGVSGLAEWAAAAVRGPRRPRRERGGS